MWNQKKLAIANKMMRSSTMAIPMTTAYMILPDCPEENT